MSIFEYDEEKTMRIIRENEREAGRLEGLKELIQKKLDKGIPIPAIAEALEETPEFIQELIDKMNI